MKQFDDIRVTQEDRAPDKQEGMDFIILKVGGAAGLQLTSHLQVFYCKNNVKGV